MKLTLLQADYVNPSLRPLVGDLPEIFAAFFGRHSEIELEVFDCVGGRLPDRAHRSDAYVITGSRHSACDRSPWVEALKELVRECREGRGKLVGICFGHQLIVEALGGEVTRSARGWNLGIKEVALVAQRPWMRPLPLRVRLLFNHRDQVVRLPDGAMLLAGDEACPVQMFEFAGRILALQAHPEYTVAYQEALMDAASASIAPEVHEAALAANRGAAADDDVVLEWIINFIRQGEERRA